MTGDPSRYPPIRDYALIGDCRSAGLVCRDGGIDWLCLSRFDSLPLFAALLDRDDGGTWSVRAIAADGGEVEVERRYLPGSNVLETTFRTAGGVLRLTDLLPVASEEEKARELRADREVLRRLECVEGEVEVEVTYDPRFGHRRRAPRIERKGELGWFCSHGVRRLALRSELPLAPRTDAPGLAGRARLTAGERRFLCLSWARGEPLVLPALGEEAERRVEESLRWWREWIGRCEYEGPFREQVLRSALTLKLMSFAPSGGIVAAPTSSLPEWIGGSRNWDYRFCWLRDASFTVRAFLDLGYRDEARAFLDWLLTATRLTRGTLGVVYDVYGHKALGEQELDGYEGYRGSRPVRMGNGAADQTQLDLYGEVLGAAFEYVARGGRLDRWERQLLVGLCRTVADRWGEADRGLWEVRGETRHFTYSKVHCWLALDRLVKMAEGDDFDLHADDLERFRACRDEIREAIELRAWSEELGSYVSWFEGEVLDASLLMLGLHGYRRPDDERMQGTVRRVLERLEERGYVYRYGADFGDGLDEPEGAFGACGFWAVEHLAMAGERQEAHRRFERLLDSGNDLGLFSEEVDPASDELLGNFPQAFTHLALVNAALHLADPEMGPEGERW